MRPVTNLGTQADGCLEKGGEFHLETHLCLSSQKSLEALSYLGGENSTNRFQGKWEVLLYK